VMPKPATVPNLLTPKPWLCQNPVNLTSSVVVYCVLDRGHKGPCEPDKPFCKGCQLLARWWKEHGENSEKETQCK
jgi:hypothetical protein